MPSHPSIPPLLSPIVTGLPEDSLTLLTSTLGATTNWLVLRFVHAALQRTDQGDGDKHITLPKSRVVLVSWLRDANFWKDAGRKLGINFQRVHIIDALSDGLGLRSNSVADVENGIKKTIKQIKDAGRGKERILLILDGLDFLVAATACSAIEVLDIVGELREHVDTTIVTASADLALMQTLNTPLEISHASLVMSIAHQAHMVVGVRGLDTGVAMDISGVLAISRGPAASVLDEDVEEKECLYYVEGDGGVRVFERGS